MCFLIVRGRDVVVLNKNDRSRRALMGSSDYAQFCGPHGIICRFPETSNLFGTSESASLNGHHLYLQLLKQ